MTAARLKSQNGDLLVRDGTTDTSIKSGVAKAYQHHDEDLTTMHKSLNLSSSTDNGTGDFTANFTSSWLDARYMYSFGLDDNDLLVIDRSIEPANNKIAVCFIVCRQSICPHFADTSIRNVLHMAFHMHKRR